LPQESSWPQGRNSAVLTSWLQSSRLRVDWISINVWS
jgi:hypothetical protein